MPARTTRASANRCDTISALAYWYLVDVSPESSQNKARQWDRIAYRTVGCMGNDARVDLKRGRDGLGCADPGECVCVLQLHTEVAGVDGNGVEVVGY